MAEHVPNILFVAYQTDRGSNGGMESATRIFEALADDFRWTLMTNRDTPRTDRWRAGGARVVQFGFNEHNPHPLRALKLALASLRVFTLAQGADLLHGNDIRSMQILAPFAWLSGKPLAFTLRDTKPAGESYGLHWHWVARRVDALVNLSDDMAAHVDKSLPVPKSRFHTINSIVDMDAFCPATDRTALRAQLGIAPNECALGMVAAFSDKKRQIEVIRNVMPALADLPIRLHLIGDFTPDTNAYSRTCADAAVKLGDRVAFHGFRRDVADWLAALDIVLVASVREGLARCMTEAMACGTPVVSFDVCSAKEMLVETGAGIVVEQDNWSELAIAVRQLINNAQKRKAMGQAGRSAAIVRFSESKIAADWRVLYAKLASQGPQ